MLDVLLEKLLNRTDEDILKPHIFFNEETHRWNCLRDWNLKRVYRSEAGSWKGLLIPEEDRWIGTNEYNLDHNLFIQEDITEGWKEFCIETWFYHPTDSKGRYQHMWYTEPMSTGCSIFVH